jgi:hypothetical protein
MFWMLIAVLALVGGGLALTRRKSAVEEPTEPWRASLGDDEPLDLDEIRRAEQEWLDEDDGWEEEDDEPAFR